MSETQSVYSLQTDDTSNSTTFYSLSSSKTKSTSDKEPTKFSSQLDHLYALLSLKKDLREVRGLVTKTEIRVKALEEEFASHRLTITLDRYLERVEMIYKKEQEEQEKLKNRGKEWEEIVKKMNILQTTKHVSYWISGFLTALCVSVPILLLYKKKSL